MRLILFKVTKNIWAYLLTILDFHSHQSLVWTWIESVQLTLHCCFSLDLLSFFKTKMKKGDLFQYLHHYYSDKKLFMPIIYDNKKYPYDPCYYNMDCHWSCDQLSLWWALPYPWPSGSPFTRIHPVSTKSW